MKPLSMLPFVAAALSAAVALHPAPARAVTTTIYVAPTGSDSAAGGETTPLRTLTKALSRAAGGEKIVLRPGSYAAASDSKARTALVTVTGDGTGTGTPTVAGLQVTGGQKLRISGLKFTGQVKFAQHPTLFGRQVATDVVLSDSEVTVPGQTCVYVRDASRSITLERDRIHDCATGVGGPYSSTGARSSGVVIADSTIEHMTADGIQFGSWDRVRIAANVIREIRDPAGVVHNDGVQLTGGSDDVEISHNRISGSRTQLILIQDAMAPVNNVRVESNLLWDADGVGVQSGAATKLRFIHNTVWNTKLGGLWLWPGMGPGGTAKVVPTDTVVANNLLASFLLKDGAKVAPSAGNVMECATGAPPRGTPVGVACVASFGLISPPSDFGLLPTSAARALGASIPVVTGDATSDVDGTPFGTPVVPGAVA
jgi:hypothetical protein